MGLPALAALVVVACSTNDSGVPTRGPDGLVPIGADAASESSFPASCRASGPGISDCGADGTGDCCATVAISGGTWNRRGDPAYPATIKPYVLDKYEITVGRFKRFVEAGEATQAVAAKYPAHYGAVPGDTEGGWNPAYAVALSADTPTFATRLATHPTRPDGTTYGKSDKTLPINNINWAEALLFCAWDGGFLPTEAMWLYAAEGGAENRYYHWTPNQADGGRPTPTLAEAAFCTQGTGNDPTDYVCGMTPTVPVPVWKTEGGKSKDGIFHINGNVNEMFQDWAGTVAVPDGDGGVKQVRAPMLTACDANAPNAINGCPRSTADFNGDTLDRRLSGGGSYDYPDNFGCDKPDGCLFPVGLLSTRFRYAAINQPSFADNTQGIRCARAAN
jgi:formylglycine-generating enzyme required for sulfatase activity